MLQEQSIQVNGLRLNLVRGPETGPPLLFLHGVTRAWQDFVPLFPPLMPRWQYHGVDFRGHGRSDRQASYLVADYVRDIVELVRTQFQEPVVIYGHSLGALTAAGVAHAVPEKVRGLILEDPPAPVFVEKIRETAYYPIFAGMRDLAGPGKTICELTHAIGDLRMHLPAGGSVRLADLRDATSLRFSAKCLRDLDPEVLSPLLAGHWLDGYPAEKTFGGIKCPTLLLRADEAAGGMLPGKEAEKLTAGIADCTVIHLPGLNHLIHWTDTPTTLRLVLGFLESL